jgi:hypothetical protein
VSMPTKHHSTTTAWPGTKSSTIAPLPTITDSCCRALWLPRVRPILRSRPFACSFFSPYVACARSSSCGRVPQPSFTYLNVPRHVT